jgi:hypothetical protein
MTSKTLLVVALGAMLPFATGSAFAASPGPKARIFAKYDANKNGVIDGDEIAAVRKAFAEDPKGEFARYDANHDGKLDDAEIAAIKPPGAGGQKGEKKGGGKKSDAEKSEKTEKS